MCGGVRGHLREECGGMLRGHLKGEGVYGCVLRGELKGVQGWGMRVGLSQDARLLAERWDAWPTLSCTGGL